MLFKHMSIIRNLRLLVVFPERKSGETREDARVKTQLQLSNELMRQKTTPEETRLETRGDKGGNQRR